MIKCRGRYRTPKITNTELLVTLHNGKKNSPSDDTRTIYASETLMNRGRPCRLNSLLGTLPHLISQE